MFLPIEHFRCEPSVGAKWTEVLRVTAVKNSASVVGHVIRDRAAASEIGHFQCQRPGEIKNVPWLQVPMEDVIIMQIIHSFGDLAQNISQLIQIRFYW